MLESVNTVQGEYIGKNNGLIISIKPDHVMVREKYRVPRGWQNPNGYFRALYVLIFN